MTAVSGYNAGAGEGVTPSPARAGSERDVAVRARGRRCRRRRSPAASAVRVAAGSMTSSTTPISTALSTPPAIRSCSAASSASTCGARSSGATSASLRRCRMRTAATGAHHGDLGARPGEHLGGAERAGVHRDVGAAVGLAGHQRDPRHDGLGERVQQLRAAAHDAVPLLADAGQVAGHVDERRPAARRTRRTSARTGPPSPPRASRGSRRAAAGCWRSRRRCGRRSGRAR